MKLSFWKLLKITLQGKATKIFFILTVMSLSFSMAVILCNAGLMDGYEHILKTGLRKNTSDLEVTSSSGFFEIENEFLEMINQEAITNYAGIIRTEGFIVKDNKSKGVLVNGIKPSEFAKINNLDIKISSEKNTIALGAEIAKELEVSIGDFITLTFTRGNQSFEELPYVTELEVSDIVTHGVHRKDSRLVYLKRSYLEEFTNSKGMVNTCLLTLDGYTDSQIKDYIKNSEEKFFELGFEARPYWKNFASLLEAVEVEKFSITVILQLIILIALFNIVAFINYNGIKKSQEFFLLRSLGLSFKSLYTFWTLFIIFIWAISCLLALLMTLFFDKVILKLPFLKIPSKVYELDHLSIHLGLDSILTIFAITFFWCLVCIGYIVFREKKKTILEGIKGQYI